MASSWRMFIDYLINTMTDGSLLNRDKMGATGLRPSYDRVMTQKYIRKMWAISKLPNEYDSNLTEMIRYQMTTNFPDCKTIINIHSKPKKVAVDTNLFKRLMGSATKEYQRQEQVFNMLDDTDQMTGKTVRLGGSRKVVITKERRDKAKYEMMSYRHVFQHQNGEGAFMRSVIIVEGLFPNEAVMVKYKEKLQGLLRGQNIGFREVRNDVTAFLTNYGVAGYVNNEVDQKTMLVSDRALSSQTPYRVRGLVGGTGICLGLDRRTYFPFMINFFGSSSAQVCLVYGRTGSGKSYMCFSTCLALIFEDVHCSVVDIKGDEWNKLMKLVPGSVEIKMGGAGARFVNTLRLDDIEVDSENADAYYEMAVTGTRELLTLMVAPDDKDNISMPDLKDVLSTAIIKTYNTHGIFRDKPETFKRTKNLSLGKVLDELSTLAKSSTYEKIGKNDLVYKVIDRCSAFLSAEGLYATAFRNEITIGDILRAPLVIYSFGKNDGAMLDTLDSIRVFMVQYLDTKKQAIRKRNKEHSAAFYEELQRCNQFGRLIQFISHSVTGSRSNNVILFLLSNDLSAFDTKDMQPVRSNITTKIIGKTNSVDLEILKDRYGCEDIVNDINLVSKDVDFENCFVIKYDTGQNVSGGAVKSEARDSAIIKTVVYKELEEQFRTRDLKEM
ncbi:hypothetical protein UT300012_24100 [Paraclostridium bifermentans]